MTLKRDRRRGDGRDTLARARPLRGLSRCHAVTQRDRDVTERRDSDTRPLALPGVTITPSVTEVDGKKDADRAKLAADPRFAAWVAAMPEGVS